MSGFFYIDGMSKQQHGPFTVSELKMKNIEPETMVWASGMADWTEARNVKELEEIFNGIASTPPTSISGTTNTPVSASTVGMYSSDVPKGINNNDGLHGKNDVRPMPKNWLIESILVTIFCCQLFGIIAIINATKVESLYYSGDYDSALQASNDAKKWCIVGICSIAFIAVAYFFLIFIGAMAGALG